MGFTVKSCSSTSTAWCLGSLNLKKMLKAWTGSFTGNSELLLWYNSLGSHISSLPAFGQKVTFGAGGKLVPLALLLLPAMTVSTLLSVFFPSLPCFLSESDSLHASMFSLPEFAACVCWACSSFRTTRTSLDTTNLPRYSFKRCFGDLAMVRFSLFACSIAWQVLLTATQRQNTLRT